MHDDQLQAGATDHSAPEDMNPRLQKPMNVDSYGAVVDNRSAMFSLNAASLGPKRAVNSWIDDVESPTSNLTLAEARACEETAMALLDLRNNGAAARSGKSKNNLSRSDDSIHLHQPGHHDSDVEVEGDLSVQSPKRTCVPTLRGLGVDFRGPEPASSSSKSNTGLNSAPAKQKSVRTPLPTCRSLVGANLPIPERIRESIEGSTFSQSYNPERGWTPINHVPQRMLRAEEDLTIPINSIIPALDVSPDIQDRRTTSTPASFSIERSPTPPLPSRSSTRATTHPVTHNAAIKVPDPSSTTGGSSSSPRDEVAEINAEASGKDDGLSNEDTGSPGGLADNSSTDVDAPASPIRREKWKGKSFATLILEALRAATSTDHKLTTNQIAAYIEEYRLTTDMKFPALPQTIRAAVLKKSRHQRKNGSWYPGLWVHCPDPGKRIGPYKLLPEGFAEDAVVPEDEEGS